MTKKRKLQLLAPIQVAPSWYFRNYLIQAEPEEVVAIEDYTKHVSGLVTDIELYQLSSEFQYFKVGFIVGHFGKRGICVSIWHWGKWLASHELFNQCWYTYGRDIRALSMLDRKEPICCQFEMPILIEEFNLFHTVATTGFDSQGRQSFINYFPKL